MFAGDQTLIFKLAQLVANLKCQIDEIWNCQGGRPLDMSVGDYHDLVEVGKSTICGIIYGLGSRSVTKEK